MLIEVLLSLKNGNAENNSIDKYLSRLTDKNNLHDLRNSHNAQDSDTKVDQDMDKGSSIGRKTIGRYGDSNDGRVDSQASIDQVNEVFTSQLSANSRDVRSQGTDVDKNIVNNEDDDEYSMIDFELPSPQPVISTDIPNSNLEIKVNEVLKTDSETNRRRDEEVESELDEKRLSEPLRASQVIHLQYI